MPTCDCFGDCSGAGHLVVLGLLVLVESCLWLNRYLRLCFFCEDIITLIKSMVCNEV